MPIVSSEIVKWHDRGNGRLSVFEQHTDHNGDMHEHRYSCPVAHNINQALLDWVPTLDSSLLSSERSSIQSRLESGEDPANITPKHLSTIQKSKRVIRALMQGEPEKLLKSAEFVQTLTDNQLDNYFTVAKRTRIRTRQNYILDNQSLFGDDVREEL